MRETPIGIGLSAASAEWGAEAARQNAPEVFQHAWGCAKPALCQSPGRAGAGSATPRLAYWAQGQAQFAPRCRPMRLSEPVSRRPVHRSSI
jgi:hypothetical protein